METKKIPVSKIERDQNNPRKTFDEEGLRALGMNMLANGQLVPIILILVGEIYRLIDGERRWRAAQIAGIKELNAVVLTEMPDEATLATLQLSLEIHKASLSLMEKSNLLARIKEKTGLGMAELAAKLQMSPPLASKLMKCQKAGPELRSLLHKGMIDIEKACLACEEPDPVKQAAIVKELMGMTREQARAKVRRKPEAQPKARRAVFALPGGMSFTFQGGDASLDDIIGHIGELMKELKRGAAQGLDVSTAQAVLRDKAKGS